MAIWHFPMSVCKINGFFLFEIPIKLEECARSEIMKANY